MDSNRRNVVIAWTFGVLLVALHLDFWRPRRDVLWFGAVPEELLYRLAWMAAATVYLWWFTARVWRSDDGDESDRGPEGGAMP